MTHRFDHLLALAGLTLASCGEAAEAPAFFSMNKSFSHQTSVSCLRGKQGENIDRTGWLAWQKDDGSKGIDFVAFILTNKDGSHFGSTPVPPTYAVLLGHRQIDELSALVDAPSLKAKTIQRSGADLHIVLVRLVGRDISEGNYVCGATGQTAMTGLIISRAIYPVIKTNGS